MKAFELAWKQTLEEHNVELVWVLDGDEPSVLHKGEHSLGSIMGIHKDLIFNRTAACRNLGFIYALRELQSDVVITTDDDCLPLPSSITGHLEALQKRVPVSWVSTMEDEYPRGFPYSVRDEAEVVLSHGVWTNVPDLDGATQLVKGIRPGSFIKKVIPKGAYFPMSAMNFAFKRKMAPYVMQAPSGIRTPGFDRNDDIFAGVYAKRAIDANGWAVVSGYSSVMHNRASNVWANLRKEAPSMEMYDTLYLGDPDNDYFKMYAKKRKEWAEIVGGII
jgi:hypothetical protein